MTKITIFFLTLFEMDVLTKKRKVYDRKEPKYDFMKYWRVVRSWAKAKHGLSTLDLDLLMFLYSEGLFSRKDFKEYDFMLSYDAKRLPHLIKQGWVHIWRQGTKKQKTLFEVSVKTRKVVGSIYKKLLKEESISEAMSHNPMYRPSAPYIQKRMKPIIRKFNREVKANKS